MDEFKKPRFLPKVSTKSSENEEKVEENSELHRIISSPKTAPNNIPKAECPYLEPNWSEKPDNQDVEYKFEVLKSGAILEEIRNLQTKPYWVIGRLDQNDIIMAHPTISRFHAVLQYRPNIEYASTEDTNEIKKNSSNIENGWYVYDLGSTHGTFLNKARIPPKTYIRMRVGHMLKFGVSLRTYILQGPDYDEEPESELTVTELKERRKQEEELKKKQEQMQEEKREKEGISWGMTEDADEETDLTINPYSTTNNEELFLDDPKKTLRGFFEREGLNLEYKCDEMSPGTFVCRIELPIDTNGKPIIAEVCQKGKKKDCVVQCALEACRILDRHGVLRQSHHEPLKRKIPTSDSDDEDDFLDRTGDIERKKIRKANAGQSVTLTYDDLLKQEKELTTKLIEIEKEISVYQENSKRMKETKSNAEDDLDNYMENLTKESISIDKTGIRKFRVEQQQLKADIQKVKKLIKIAKPFDLPPISGAYKSSNSNEKKSTSLPLFGKRNKFKFTLERASLKTQTITKEFKSDEEEFDEDDDENVENTKKGEPLKMEENNFTNIVECSEKKSESIDDKSTKFHEDSQKDVIKLETKLYNVVQPKVLESLDDCQKSVDLDDCQKSVDKIEPNSSKSNKDTDAHDNITESVEKITEWKSEMTSTAAENMEIEQQQDSQQKDIETDSLVLSDILEVEDHNQLNKKRKHRARNRHRRENIDIDDYDEFNDVEKHSEWIPPNNQSGDGRTSLNDKFGY